MLEIAAKEFPKQDWGPHRQGLDRDELGKLADLLGQSLTRDDLLRIVRKVFARPQGNSPEIYGLLRALPFAGVLNSNWDEMLCEELARAEPAPVVLGT